MTSGGFQIVGDSLTGHGVAFDVAPLRATGGKLDVLVDIANVCYRQGRDSVLVGCDDRFDLSCTVDALRALATIVGPSATGDRYRRSADIIARLLHDQEVARAG